LSAQKLASATRNKGRQPNQPAATIARNKSAAPIPYNSTTLEKTPPTHAVTTSGAKPRIAAGRTIDTIHASNSFVRLISASRLPAMASSDFCFGLETSSSASPLRGSKIGRARTGSYRSSLDSALEGETSGARIASGKKISGGVKAP
jgi:hypothetical protein